MSNKLGVGKTNKKIYSFKLFFYFCISLLENGTLLKNKFQILLHHVILLRVLSYHAFKEPIT